MGYVVGIVLALSTVLFARVVGFDRDRAFYPTVLVVVASYYVLFAVMGESTRALIIEAAVMIVFAGFAVVGFKQSVWLIVAGLIGHGLFDFVHPHIVTNPGVPEWWPAFCLAYDVTIAAALAWFITRNRGAANNEKVP